MNAIPAPDASRAAEVAKHLHRLADREFDGYCDLYAGIARSIAADPATLARIAALPGAPKVLPVLALAAVHDLCLAEPDQPLAAVYRGDPSATDDPGRLIRALVAERAEDLRATVAARTLQTNEVGRLAPVVAGLTAVHRRFGRPLAIVEIGASAGLNLHPERYAYDFVRPPEDGSDPVTVAALGDRTSTVRLVCECRGDLLPPLDELPSLAPAIGIDLRPVDVRDERERRWLAACLWPQVPDRPQRLAAALERARLDPPAIRAGSALDLLPAVVAEISQGFVPCVVSTWVLAYFSKPEREAFGRLLDTIGAPRDLAVVTGEYQGIVPWLPPMERSPTDGSPTDRSPAGSGSERSTVLGVTTWHDGVRRAVTAARMQAHGRWIEWLDAGTAAEG